ncbi:hypothetical protein GCM10022237_25120 [Nocardioides ginsengisoli]|uniref:Uncharacterized protein n=1 Tax=Nocardioides ginsengisoli TaxID=363868 RepID=A0ABW3W6X7_9ACTN
MTTPRPTPAESVGFSLVVLAPTGRLRECRRAIEDATRRGGAVFTHELPAATGLITETLAEAAGLIADAVGHAIRLHPDAPVVLVGHGDAGAAVTTFAELSPEGLAGVVVTGEKRRSPGR